MVAVPSFFCPLFFSCGFVVLSVLGLLSLELVLLVLFVLAEHGHFVKLFRVAVVLQFKNHERCSWQVGVEPVMKKDGGGW